MTEITLIRIATLLLFILVIFTAAAIIDRILEVWKETAPPPKAKRIVTWCDTHGHALVLAENNRVYRCGICELRIVRDPADLPGLLGSAELGHQGQTGRAA